MIVETSGTQTAVIGTEHSLSTPSTGKTRVLLVNAFNLAVGDTLELRIKGAVLAAGTESVIRLSTFIGALTEPHLQSPPIVMPQGGTITLKQTAGTGRVFPWAVCTLD